MDPHEERFKRFRIDLHLGDQQKQDYHDEFVAWLRRLIRQKLASGRLLRHRVFRLSAGPYRPYDVDMKHEGTGKTMRIDVYSVARLDGRLERHHSSIIEAL